MLARLDTQAVWMAAGNPRMMAAVAWLYHAADAVIASHRPLCKQHGDCCRFEQYGHRLFATTLEFAYLVAGQPAPVPPVTKPSCPFLQVNRCTARGLRPIACRVFFCEPTAAPWQGPLTERLLGMLRRLHVRQAVPYVYREWLGGLQDLHSAGLPW